MSGTDSRAPLARREPPLPAALPEGDSAGRRIGWLGDLDGALAMEDGILPLCEQALGTLTDAGCHVEPARLGMSAAEIWACWLTWRHALVAGRFGALYAAPAKRALMKPELIWEIEGGLRLSAVDLYVASAARTRLYQALAALFARYDALALPSAQCFPFRRDVAWPTAIAGHPIGQLSSLDGSRRSRDAVGQSRGLPAGWPRRCERSALGAAIDRPARRRPRPPAFRADLRGAEPARATTAAAARRPSCVDALTLACWFWHAFRQQVHGYRPLIGALLCIAAYETR